MVAIRTLVPVLGLGIPVAWRATTWAEEATLRLRFRHLGGATRGMDVTWRIEPDPDGCRVSIEHDFRPRFAPWAAVRRPAVRSADRGADARDLQGDRRGGRRFGAGGQSSTARRPTRGAAEARARPGSDPNAARRRRPRHDPPTRLDHGSRRDHADRDRPRRVLGRRAGGSIAGQADRPLRPLAVPLPGRRADRRLRPARPHGPEDRPAARSVQPVRARRRTAGARRTRGWARAALGPAAARTRSGSGSTSAARSAASPTPRASTSASSSAASAPWRRTSRSRSSAARRRRTSGSRWTSAARSSPPPTPAHRARSRWARHCARFATGPIDAAIAGGAEVPLSPLAFGAFDIIRALSPGSNDTPERAARPFDAGRDGFVMGEGVGLLVLEAEEVARARGAAPYAEVMGYGSTSDAHHMVQPRADGREAARAATLALADAGVAADELDYVNAHASSTPLGDVAEARALALALGERARTIPVSGTKALYGHPLGASSAIEAAICSLGIQRGLGARHREPGDTGSGGDRPATGPPARRPGRPIRAGALDVLRLRRPQRGTGVRGGRLSNRTRRCQRNCRSGCRAERHSFTPPVRLWSEAGTQRCTTECRQTVEERQAMSRLVSFRGSAVALVVLLAAACTGTEPKQPPWTYQPAASGGAPARVGGARFAGRVGRSVDRAPHDRRVARRRSRRRRAHGADRAGLPRAGRSLRHREEHRAKSIASPGGEAGEPGPGSRRQLLRRAGPARHRGPSRLRQQRLRVPVLDGERRRRRR